MAAYRALSSLFFPLHVNLLHAASCPLVVLGAHVDKNNDMGGLEQLHYRLHAWHRLRAHAQHLKMRVCDRGKPVVIFALQMNYVNLASKLSLPHTCCLALAGPLEVRGFHVLV